MSTQNKIREEFHDYDIPAEERPPLAVVGSQISHDEELFGRVFDPHVFRRFIPFVRPYKRMIVFALLGVLLFTATQLAVPLIIRITIDNALLADGAGRTALYLAAAAFGVVIVVN